MLIREITRSPRRYGDTAAEYTAGAGARRYEQLVTTIEQFYGKPAFECFASMPEFKFAFNEGMTAISAALAPAVLEAYDFPTWGR